MPGDDFELRNVAEPREKAPEEPEAPKELKTLRNKLLADLCGSSTDSSVYQLFLNFKEQLQSFLTPTQAEFEAPTQSHVTRTCACLFSRQRSTELIPLKEKFEAIRFLIENFNNPRIAIDRLGETHGLTPQEIEYVTKFLSTISGAKTSKEISAMLTNKLNKLHLVTNREKELTLESRINLIEFLYASMVTGFYPGLFQRINVALLAANGKYLSSSDDPYFDDLLTFIFYGIYSNIKEVFPQLIDLLKRLPFVPEKTLSIISDLMEIFKIQVKTIVANYYQRLYQLNPQAVAKSDFPTGSIYEGKKIHGEDETTAKLNSPYQLLIEAIQEAQESITTPRAALTVEINSPNARTSPQCCQIL